MTRGSNLHPTPLQDRVSQISVYSALRGASQYHRLGYLSQPLRRRLLPMAVQDSRFLLTINCRTPSTGMWPCNRRLEIFRLKSEEHTSELQSHLNFLCRLLL